VFLRKGFSFVFETRLGTVVANPNEKKQNCSFEFCSKFATAMTMEDESARSEDEVPSEASAPKVEAHQRTQNVFVSACATEHGADVCAMMDSSCLMLRHHL
jgi:hypothetical protein